MLVISVLMFLYQVELEDGCWYVGHSKNPQKRWNQHVAGKAMAAGWCKTHPPLKPMEDHFQFWEIPYITLYQVEEMEDVLTVELMKKYGKLACGEFRVRGGYRVQPHLKTRLPRHK